MALLSASARGEVVVLDRAQFMFSSAETPPAHDAAWVAQGLPDNWNVTRPNQGGQVWYRLSFELPTQPQRTQAVYIRKLSMNAQLWINGALLGDGGRFTEPVARNWNRPLFFVLPPSLLRAGSNTLHIRLRAYPNSRGGLAQIRIGAERELRPEYEQRYFVQTILPQLCNIVVAALGLFAFVLWVRRRKEPIYVFFFVFSLLWALRSTNMFVRDIPFPAFYWEIWVHSSFGWCALLFTALALRYCGLKWPKLDWALMAYALAGPIWMYLAGPTNVHLAANNWNFVIVPAAILVDVLFIRHALRHRSLAHLAMAIAYALLIGASAHDGLVHRNVLAFDSIYLTSFFMIPVSLVMGWLLTTRFVHALNEAEKLNVELEARVAHKHAELEQNYRRLQELERQSAMVEERQRLLSEMHDGVGSQLIATLDLVEHGAVDKDELAEALREALDSLRLTMCSVHFDNDDLLTVLATLRDRLEARLKRQNIALNWRVRDVPSLDNLTPQNVLHILRIVQEALTNSVKHAKPKSITLETSYCDDYVYLTIGDDGRGFVGERAGYGLTNMHARAQQIGARLRVESSAQGTTLRLVLPRARSAAPSAEAAQHPVAA